MNVRTEIAANKARHLTNAALAVSANVVDKVFFTEGNSPGPLAWDNKGLEASWAHADKAKAHAEHADVISRYCDREGTDLFEASWEHDAAAAAHLAAGEAWAVVGVLAMAETDETLIVKELAAMPSFDEESDEAATA